MSIAGFTYAGKTVTIETKAFAFAATDRGVRVCSFAYSGGLPYLQYLDFVRKCVCLVGPTEKPLGASQVGPIEKRFGAPNVVNGDTKRRPMAASGRTRLFIAGMTGLGEPSFMEVVLCRGISGVTEL